MKTKYDWSNVPKEVKWIATNSLNISGRAFGYNKKPVDGVLSWDYAEQTGVFFYIDVKPHSGDWRDSLEERPHGF